MLSKRLQTVLDYIEPNDNLADIGCDHGYLALNAIYKGVRLVQLVDNKIGPLNVAKDNLKNIEKNAKVIYTLSDGLSNIDLNINVVAICGMGGDLISKILLDNLYVAKKMKCLILEANSKVDVLRRQLNENKFKILDEKIIEDKGKYYQIIKCAYDEQTLLLSELEYEFGPILLKNKNDVFKQYLKTSINKLELIKEKNNLSSGNLERKIVKLKEVLNETI